MYFYKIIEDGVITQIGSGMRETTEFISITQEEHQRLGIMMQSKPSDTLEQKYVLDAETEEYEAVETTHDYKVRWYFDAIRKEEMSLQDVPEDYRTEVEALLPNNPYGIPNEQYAAIVATEQQNYRNQLASEVSNDDH